ncbi:hypothetical protein [Dictyobacter halimunensis]|uniref:hypothetical protein n=1 Tax=Dictyobacter halimunensis TaxID=3026934 RepID=UPI0030C6E6A2
MLLQKEKATSNTKRPTNENRPRGVDLQRSTGPRAPAIAGHVPPRYHFPCLPRWETWFPHVNVAQAFLKANVPPGVPRGARWFPREAEPAGDGGRRRWR